MSKQKHIVYLGSSGFPYGMAEIQKIILISKSLVLKNNEVTVISRKGVHEEKEYPALTATGKYDNIHYTYASGQPFRPGGFLNRNLLKVKGLFNEFRTLRQKKKERKLDFAIISTHNFSQVVYYTFLGKVLGFKTILNYVEFYSSVKRSPGQFRKTINDQLFDKLAPKIVDSVLPISELLINHLKKVAPNKQYLKIPGLTDFDRYNGIPENRSEKYILFCGAAGYMEIIHFIIDAYNKVADESVYLYLVINGTNAEKQHVADYFNNTRKAKLIKMFSRLSEKELFTFYKNALALLIPLRPTFQDIARFPHKTGEYMASGNPVISTNIGEIKNYFQDKKNIFLAEEYDADQYAEAITYVIENQEHAKIVGLEGKKLAQQLFDYKHKAAAIDGFLEKQMIRS